MDRVPFTKNVVVISLFISIFAILIMGFIIGSFIENLKLKDLKFHVIGLLNEELKNVVVTDDQKVHLLTNLYNSLNIRDSAIIGLNLIGSDGVIIYSDESSLIGKAFSGKNIFIKTLEGKISYSIDKF